MSNTGDCLQLRPPKDAARTAVDPDQASRDAAVLFLIMTKYKQSSCEIAFFGGGESSLRAARFTMPLCVF